MIGIILFTLFDAQENLEIVLGLTYALIFFLSSFASRYSYLILKKIDRNYFLNFTWILTAIVFVLLGVFVNKFYLVIMLFIFIYLLQNIRKPIMVGKIGDQFIGNSKASVLSVESQITSLSIVVLAPSLGFIYDNFGPQYVFYSLAILSIIMFYITKKEH
jgi:predicted MFS family arabinose efflux permease